MIGRKKTFFTEFLRRPLPLAGLLGVGFLLFLGIFAPFIANGRPLVAWGGDFGNLCFPFWRAFFAPDSTEYLIEKAFNYLLLLFVIALPIAIFSRKAAILAALLLLIPFATVERTLDKTDYRIMEGQKFFAPIPYGPFELVGNPYQKPDRRFVLGTDEIGRSLASRIVYGARVSLAVGILASLVALGIGVPVGLLSGYLKGAFDLVSMRLLEILMCFPTFLLLLILMAMLGDYKFEQSILIVIAVLGLTGWMGIAFLARGEVLKQSALPYIESCVVSGMRLDRILLRHLLPNIAPPVIIAFSFGVAGAMLAESGLSFLGFGVSTPMPSWGSILRAALDNPLSYWHLMLFPGILLLIAVTSFNFIGEGLRRALDPKAK